MNIPVEIRIRFEIQRIFIVLDIDNTIMILLPRTEPQVYGKAA